MIANKYKNLSGIAMYKERIQDNNKETNVVNTMLADILQSLLLKTYIIEI